MTRQLLTAVIFFFAAMAHAGELRVGIIGCDTSHATAFAEILHNPKNTGDLAGLRVVAAYPGGSADIPSSINRVPQFVEKLKAMNVEIVDSVDALLPKVDVVLLESSDGRVHLEQAKKVFAAKKPVFIDKPVSASLKDAVEIFKLAKEAGVPCFTSSALRFCTGVAAVRKEGVFGDVMGCEAWSPYSTEPNHPDLFWYGIHGVETLFTIMGPGCVKVQRVKSDQKDVVVIGTWKDGRIGIFRGLAASKGGYGATVYGTKSVGSAGGFTGYQGLVAAVAKFLKSGEVPVSADESIEIYAFMEAADESKRQDGAAVTIESVMAKVK
jgi:predicted dehydrogenase